MFTSPTGDIRKELAILNSALRGNQRLLTLNVEGSNDDLLPEMSPREVHIHLRAAQEAENVRRNRRGFFQRQGGRTNMFTKVSERGDDIRLVHNNQSPEIVKDGATKLEGFSDYEQQLMDAKVRQHLLFNQLKPTASGNSRIAKSNILYHHQQVSPNATNATQQTKVNKVLTKVSSAQQQQQQVPQRTTKPAPIIEKVEILFKMHRHVPSLQTLFLDYLQEHHRSSLVKSYRSWLSSPASPVSAQLAEALSSMLQDQRKKEKYLDTVAQYVEMAIGKNVTFLSNLDRSKKTVNKFSTTRKATTVTEGSMTSSKSFPAQHKNNPNRRLLGVDTNTYDVFFAELNKKKLIQHTHSENVYRGFLKIERGILSIFPPYLCNFKSMTFLRSSNSQKSRNLNHNKTGFHFVASEVKVLKSSKNVAEKDHVTLTCSLGSTRVLIIAQNKFEMKCGFVHNNKSGWCKLRINSIESRLLFVSASNVGIATQHCPQFILHLFNYKVRRASETTIELHSKYFHTGYFAALRINSKDVALESHHRGLSEVYSIAFKEKKICQIWFQHLRKMIARAQAIFQEEGSEDANSNYRSTNTGSDVIDSELTQQHDSVAASSNSGKPLVPANKSMKRLKARCVKSLKVCEIMSGKGNYTRALMQLWKCLSHNSLPWRNLSELAKSDPDFGLFWKRYMLLFEHECAQFALQSRHFSVAARLYMRVCTQIDFFKRTVVDILATASYSCQCASMFELAQRYANIALTVHSAHENEQKLPYKTIKMLRMVKKSPTSFKIMSEHKPQTIEVKVHISGTPKNSSDKLRALMERYEVFFKAEDGKTSENIKEIEESMIRDLQDFIQT
eukprot:g2771.t1